MTGPIGKSLCDQIRAIHRAYNRISYAAERNPGIRDRVKKLEVQCLGQISQARVSLEACAEQCKDECIYPERDRIDKLIGVDDGRK